MSERDTFHKEMEKLQDEVHIIIISYRFCNNIVNSWCVRISIKILSFVKVSEARKIKKQEEEERRKISCQVEMLKREVEQSLQERDKAMRESHDLRYDM